MRDRCGLIIPPAVFLLSLWLRLILISRGPFSVDALALAVQSRHTLDTLHLHGLTPLGFPLVIMLGAATLFLTRLAGAADPVFAVNLMSAVFGALAAGAMYLAARELFGEKAGVFAAALFSLSPIFLGLTVYGSGHAACMFFHLAGVYCLLIYLKEGTGKSLAFSGVSFGLMAACRPQDFVLVLPATAWIFFAWEDGTRDGVGGRKRFADGLRWLASAGGAAVLSYLPFVLGQKGSFAGRFLDYVHYCLVENYIGIFSPRLVLVGQWLGRNFTPAGTAAVAGGFLLLCARRTRLAAFLLLWFAVPVLYYGNLYMTVTARYFVLALPPMCLAAAYVFSVFAGYKKRIAPVAAGCFLLIAAGMFARVYPVLQFRCERAVLPEFARWIGSRTEEDARIVGTDERLFIRYYAGRATVPRPQKWLRMYTAEELGRFQEEVDRLLREGTPVYITSVALYSYDEGAQFSSFVKAHYRLEPRGSYFYEDWHSGPLRLAVRDESLFRVLEKKLD